MTLSFFSLATSKKRNKVSTFARRTALFTEPPTEPKRAIRILSGHYTEQAQRIAYAVADPAPTMYANLPNLRRTCGSGCPDTGVSGGPVKIVVGAWTYAGYAAVEAIGSHELARL